MVDDGSSTEVLFLATLWRMKYDESLIQRSMTKLVDFNGTRSSVIGKVVMPMTLRKKTIFCTMMVVDNESPYNVVLGRP